MSKLSDEISEYYGIAERISRGEDVSDELAHYGIKRRSGRYPWGSGEDPYQHSCDFLGRVKEMRGKGLSETEIAESMNLTTSELRTEIGLANEERKIYRIASAKTMKEDGKNTSEIARHFGVNESTVRGWFEQDNKSSIGKAKALAEQIKKAVDESEYGMVDITSGVDAELGVSKERMRQALYLLESEGYNTFKGGIPQVTNPGQQTTQKVLCKPGVEHKEIYQYEKVGTLSNYHSEDGGETFHRLEYPASMDSKRLKIRYAEEGGIDNDGLIQLRPGVADLSLSGSRYSQVRILVDGDRYMKGMAVYGDPKDFPDGVDVIFNTNKTKDVPMRKVLKEIHTEDPMNPFGSAIKANGQNHYTDEKGVEHLGLINKRADEGDWSEWSNALPSQFLSKQNKSLVDGDRYMKGMAVYGDPKDFPDGVDVIFNTNKTKDVPMRKVLKEIHTEDPMNPFGSAIKANGQNHYTDEKGVEHLGLINKRADEGDWSEWSNALPSQFLSKQNKSLVDRQLKQALSDKKSELDEINSITNPTVRKYYLNSFADDCDAAAVNLKAAALPGQKYHVIIPANTLKDNECYAPNYENGTQLALIRYPHGGPFEIPIVTVNNKNKQCREMLGTDIGDAICINKHNADRMSGADFDGDSVMSIPTGSNGIKISSKKELAGLKGFDPKDKYSYHEGMRVMGKKQTQKEMGVISNLITDMTLQGASESELAAAVRHSMVVIDAAKHKLDYKQSEIDNNIADLKARYQRHVDPETGKVKIGGAVTLLSQAKSPARIPKRQGQAHTNIADTPWYDPDRPEGAVVYKTSADAYYTKKKVNKKTGEVTETPAIRTDTVPRMSLHDDARELLSEHPSPIESAYGL